MPNIKSAIKRVRVSEMQRTRNVNAKSELRSTIKKANEALDQDGVDATELINKAVKLIDKAASNNILHKNTAARKKSALVKALNNKA